MKSLWYLLLLWIPLIGCASFKETERTNREYVTKQTMHSLAGIYESMPVIIEDVEHFDEPIGIGDSPYQNFLFDRFSLAPTKNYAESAANYVVEIEPVDKNNKIKQAPSNHSAILVQRAVYAYFQQKPVDGAIFIRWR